MNTIRELLEPFEPEDRPVIAACVLACIFLIGGMIANMVR